MDQTEHPIRLAAIAAVSTIGVCTLIGSQWIFPTLTASLNYDIARLKDQLLEKDKINLALKGGNEALSQRIDEARKSSQRKLAALSEENNKLKERLFIYQSANMFLMGDPYPVGLDKIKIGDPEEKIRDVYQGDSIKETGRNISVTKIGPVFRAVIYTHSAIKKNEGKIDSIRYDLRNIDRIFDKSLPKVPDSWIEGSLRRSLGEPFIVGTDSDCLLWKHSDRELVYYRTKTDWFEISGHSTYPPGCSITSDQVNQKKPHG